MVDGNFFWMICPESFPIIANVVFLNKIYWECIDLSIIIDTYGKSKIGW